MFKKLITKIREKCEKECNIISNISMLIFIAVTIFPNISVSIIAISSISIWIGVNIIINTKDIIEFFVKPNKYMYIIYFWIFINFIYMVIGYDKQINLYFLNYVRLMITSVLFVYYSKNKEYKTMNIILIYSISILIVVNLITIIANICYPNLSRVLSTGIKLKMNTYGIGSYQHVYAIILLLIVSILSINKEKILKKHNVERIIYVLFIITSLIMVIITEFAIAIILLGIGLLLGIIIKYNNKRILIIFGIISIVIIIFQRPLGKLLIDISDSIKSYNMSMRVKDIGIMLNEQNIENTIDLNIRVEMYTKSLDEFIKSPIIGKGNVETGKHSTLLDSMAKYGIIGCIPFILMLYTLIIGSMNSIQNKYNKKLYGICIIIFLILMLVNTTMFVAIYYTLFVLIPIFLNRENINSMEVKNEDTLDC